MIMDKRCPICKGQGTVPDPHGVLSTKKACPICMGKGFNLVPRDAPSCSFCHGSGQVLAEGSGTKLCPDCKGLGSVW
jgi:DnaJ-class molecular chaperone